MINLYRVNKLLSITWAITNLSTAIVIIMSVLNTTNSIYLNLIKNSSMNKKTIVLIDIFKINPSKTNI